MSILDGLGSYTFWRKTGKTRAMREEMEGKVSNSRQNRHFYFVDDMIKVLFQTLYFDFSCKTIMFPAKKKVSLGETKALKS